ncbi:MAG: hypothetical protein Q8P12_05465 [bacterium]|nr:hypothetical protein [bacterium]MDZ4346784.1 hypothetical protein [Candidatus Binatia bacterium]
MKQKTSSHAAEDATNLKGNWTPGPWTTGTVEANETRYTQPIFTPAGKCIGVVYGDVDHKWTDEHRANAALIANAPAMAARIEELGVAVKGVLAALSQKALFTADVGAARSFLGAVLGKADQP